MGWLRRELEPHEHGFGQYEPCPDCHQVDRLRVARFDAHSSRKGRARRQFFRNFGLDGPAASATPAFNAALRFASSPSGWLVLTGPTGCGKSHLAAAISNHLNDERNLPALFLTVPDLMDSLRSEIQASQEGRVPATAGLDEVKRAPVLILDDLGAERSTPWVEEQLFLLLDYRYRMELPTVVITNEELSALPARIESRLADTDLSTVVYNPAPDYRRRKVDASD